MQDTQNPPPSGPTPQQLIGLGIQQAKKGNFSDALTTFNQALQIDPRCAPALELKGQVLLRQNRFTDAVKNLTQALQIYPKYVDALYYRGVAYGGLAEFDSAIADFTGVINLSAGYAPAYAGRGKARFFKYDFHETVSDTTQALALDPKLTDSYYYRGLAERSLGDTKTAAADFQNSSRAGLAYGAFWLWVLDMESARKEAAQKQLADFSNAGATAADDWTHSLGDYLLKRIDQGTLLRRSRNSDSRLAHPCEAWFFIGMTKRLAGNITGAQAAFQQAIATGSKASVEYTEAQLELVKLSKT